MPVAVAAGDGQTVDAAIQMLRIGGNAVDAAVAGMFAALLAEPPLINLGGGGIALVGHGDTVEAYDFMANMPSGQPHPDMDFFEVVVQFEAASQSFWMGRASVAVPGLVAGLHAMHADHGRLAWAQVLEPAIRLAEEGAIISPAQAHIIGLLAELYRYDPALRELFLPEGRPLRPGTRLKRPRLARTLRLLAEQGPDAFYRGPIAQAIVADQKAHGGLITAQDLANYRVWRTQPLQRTYRNAQVWLPGPPSKGGGLVAFTLALLEEHALGQMEPLGVNHVRLLAEAMRLTQYVRPLWDAQTERPQDFFAPAFIAEYRARLRRALAQGPFHQEPAEPPTSPYTTHISVADADGRMVSMTATAGEDAGFMVPEWGFRMNNMLGEADLHDEGFHRLQPGARLGTMMTPLLACWDTPQGRRTLAVGSGGSSRIRSAVLQTFSYVQDFDYPLEQAVEAPRIHYERGVLHLEGGVPARTAQALAAMGYRVNPWANRSMYFGGAHAVVWQPTHAQAAGDPRRGGAAYAE